MRFFTLLCQLSLRETTPSYTQEQGERHKTCSLFHPIVLSNTISSILPHTIPHTIPHKDQTLCSKTFINTLQGHKHCYSNWTNKLSKLLFKLLSCVFTSISVCGACKLLRRSLGQGHVEDLCQRPLESWGCSITHYGTPERTSTLPAGKPKGLHPSFAFLFPSLQHASPSKTLHISL